MGLFVHPPFGLHDMCVCLQSAVYKKHFFFLFFSFYFVFLARDACTYSWLLTRNIKSAAFLTSPALRIPSSKDVLFSQPAHSKHPLQHRRLRRRCCASLAVPRPRGAARTTPLSAFPLALRGSFKMRSRREVRTC